MPMMPMMKCPKSLVASNIVSCDLIIIFISLQEQSRGSLALMLVDAQILLNHFFFSLS